MQLEQFEYPLPVIKVDTEKIIIETSMAHEGGFNIKNTGGGVLTCRITSNFKGMSFSNREASGNNINVLYALNLDGYNPGDTIRTGILITSNGGEVYIPVVINVTHKAIIAKDGEQIYSLKDFTNYCKKEPLAARQLFITNGFTMWLGSIHFEHMEILEHLYADSNTQRALDNFLILSRQKKRAAVVTETKSVDITKRINDAETVTEYITVKKTGWGYAEASVRAEGSAPWLKVLTEKITPASFKDNGEALVSLQIDKKLVKGKFEREKIIITSDNDIKISVNVKTEPALKAALSKTSFESDDSGFLQIQNNTGKDCLIGVSAKDGYVRFSAKSYFVKDYLEIPFTVRITALQGAQLSIRKQPVVETEIYIKTIVNDITIKKTLVLYIGSIQNRINIV